MKVVFSLKCFFIIALMFSKGLTMVSRESVNLLDIKCESLWGKEVKIKICKLEPLGGNEKSFEIKYYMEKVPINTLTATMQLLKYDNGIWRPFMYKAKVDVCKFFEMGHSPKAFRFNFLGKIFFGMMDGHTNVKACPLKDRLVRVTNVTTAFVANALKYVPLPGGTYGIATKWFTGTTGISSLEFYANFT